MAGGVIGEDVASALNDLATAEDRPESEILALATRTLLGLSPGARRALSAIDGGVAVEERAFAMRRVSRSLLKAYEDILDARHLGDRPVGANAAPDEDEAIGAEAVRLCRT